MIVQMKLESLNNLLKIAGEEYEKLGFSIIESPFDGDDIDSSLEYATSLTEKLTKIKTNFCVDFSSVVDKDNDVDLKSVERKINLARGFIQKIDCNNYNEKRFISFYFHITDNKIVYDKNIWITYCACSKLLGYDIKEDISSITLQEYQEKLEQIKYTLVKDEMPVRMFCFIMWYIGCMFNKETDVLMSKFTDTAKYLQGEKPNMYQALNNIYVFLFTFLGNGTIV